MQMHTPPVTKLKGDLLLELKDVKLQINEENKKLEVATRKRIDAEESFNQREISILERERGSKHIEERYGSIFDSAEQKLEEINSEISTRNRAIEKQNETISNNENRIEKTLRNIEKIDKNGEERMKHLNINCENIQNSIDKKIQELDSLNRQILSVKNEIEEFNKEMREKIEIFDRRKKFLDERERKSEETRSDLRLWSVRLNKKYGGFLTNSEKELIEIK